MKRLRARAPAMPIVTPTAYADERPTAAPPLPRWSQAPAMRPEDDPVWRYMMRRVRGGFDDRVQPETGRAIVQPQVAVVPQPSTN